MVFREETLERVTIPLTRLNHVRLFRVGDYGRVGAKIGDIMVGSVSKVFMEELSMVVEKNVPALEDLKSWRRTDLANDAEIFQRIGDERAMFLPLAHIFHIMALGERAGCLMKGIANRAFTQLPAKPQDTEEETKRYEIWWAILQGQLALAARKVSKDPRQSEPNDWCPSNSLFTG